MISGSDEEAIDASSEEGTYGLDEEATDDSDREDLLKR